MSGYDFFSLANTANNFFDKNLQQKLGGKSDFPKLNKNQKRLFHCLQKIKTDGLFSLSEDNQVFWDQFGAERWQFNGLKFPFVSVKDPFFEGPSKPYLISCIKYYISEKQKELEETEKMIHQIRNKELHNVRFLTLIEIDKILSENEKLNNALLVAKNKTQELHTDYFSYLESSRKNLFGNSEVSAIDYFFKTTIRNLDFILLSSVNAPLTPVAKIPSFSADTYTQNLTLTTQPHIFEWIFGVDLKSNDSWLKSLEQD